MSDLISHWKDTFIKQEKIVEDKFLMYYEYQGSKNDSIRELLES